MNDSKMTRRDLKPALVFLSGEIIAVRTENDLLLDLPQRISKIVYLSLRTAEYVKSQPLS